MPLKKITITITFLCFIYLVLLLFGTLWPFETEQENDVNWSGKKRGLEFHRHGTTMKTSLRGLGYTKEFFKLPEYINPQTNVVTISISLSSRIQPINGLGFIISFDDELSPEKLIIAQWRNALIVRKRNDNSDEYTEIGAAHVFENGKRCEISITFSTSGTNIYLDGNLKESHPNFSYKTVDELFNGRLLVGNSANGKSPWAGTIYQLAIYEGESFMGERSSQVKDEFLNGFDNPINQDSLIAFYGFEEQTGQFVYNRPLDRNHLYIPTIFTMLEKSYLISPFRDIRFNAGFYFDVLINVLLFIPMSVLLAFILIRMTSYKRIYIYVFTVIICSVMSLLIEFIQVYIPQRSSSILDLGLNILGAILGIYLFKYVLKIFPMIKTKEQI